MAKNYTVTQGTGTTIAADEVTYGGATANVQAIKIMLGADGAYDIILDSGQQTMANSVPVTLASDQTAVPVTASSAGVAAHDAAVSGNPILNGLTAQRARPSAVSADGDVVRAVGDRYGRTQTVGVDLTVLPLDATNSGDTSFIPAPGVGTRLKLVRVEASNTHATTALTVGLKSTSVASGSVFGKKYLPAAGGTAVWTFPGGHILCGDNEALSVNLSAAGTVSFTAYYEPVAS